MIDASTARVKFKGGDYRESDIEHLAMEDQTMLAIVADWIDKAYSKGRLSSVFFCITVAHANKMCMYLRDAGVEAAVVTAETPAEERKKILEDFENGVINALCLDRPSLLACMCRSVVEACALGVTRKTACCWTTART